jgi:hypothetical protein
MLQLKTADPHTCSRVLEMIGHKLEDLNRQYEEIKRLRHELSAYKLECEHATSNRQYCPVIEDFIRPRRRTGHGGSKRGRKL